MTPDGTRRALEPGGPQRREPVGSSRANGPDFGRASQPGFGRANGPSFDEITAFVARSRALEESRRQSVSRGRGRRLTHWWRVVTG